MGRPWKPGEPLYLETDRDAVFEWMEAEALKCPGCGMSRDETMNKDAQGQFKSRALRCHACAERDRKQTDWSKDEHDPAGMLFTIERLED